MPEIALRYVVRSVRKRERGRARLKRINSRKKMLQERISLAFAIEALNHRAAIVLSGAHSATYSSHVRQHKLVYRAQTGGTNASSSFARCRAKLFRNALPVLSMFAHASDDHIRQAGNLARFFTSILARGVSKCLSVSIYRQKCPAAVSLDRSIFIYLYRACR